MKKLFVLFAATAFSCCVIAQDTKMESKPAQGKEQKMMNNDHKMNAPKDVVMMRDGKMMVRKDGKWMAMDKEMTMTNGTKVMTDGTVMKSDGTKMMMIGTMSYKTKAEATKAMKAAADCK